MSNIREVQVKAKFSVDTTELEAAEKKRDELAAKELELRRRVEKTANRIASIARSSIGLFRNIVTLSGNALGAVGNASLIIIEQIIAVAVSWFALQVAIASTPLIGQVVAGFSLALAATALGIAIGQGVGIAQGKEALDTKINTAISALGNLGGIAQGLGGG